MNTAKTASALAMSTAIAFFLLLVIVLTQGISQQYFEMVHAPAKYTEDIVKYSSTLNIIFTLDNIFIILYTCTAFFTISIFCANAAPFVSIAAYILTGLVALLDFAENFHIYALTQQAKSGLAVTASAIQWQAAESMMKWHLAYAAFFMLGFLLPSQTAVEKMLKYALWFWFVPSGVLVYALVDTNYESLFQWIRFLNLLSGFVLIWIIMQKRIIEKSIGT
jgi:hypothetical protein